MLWRRKQDFPATAGLPRRNRDESLTSLTAAALLTAGTAATAQTAGDAQCILVSNVVAGQAKDPDAKKIAEASERQTNA